jgi:hypothetical protein
MHALLAAPGCCCLLNTERRGRPRRSEITSDQPPRRPCAAACVSRPDRNYARKPQAMMHLPAESSQRSPRRTAAGGLRIANLPWQLATRERENPTTRVRGGRDGHGFLGVPPGTMHPHAALTHRRQWARTYAVSGRCGDEVAGRGDARVGVGVLVSKQCSYLPAVGP